MPLPDADKKSPRVYTLSQNLDLENLAFATMQSIGQPINIEELNEDELRRLVLVNLARLSVKGEWNGLLTTPSGPNSPSSGVMTAANAFFYPHQSAPWGGSHIAAAISSSRVGENNVGGTVTYPIYFPFVSPYSADIDKLGVRSLGTDGGPDLSIAVYSNTSDNIPGSMIGGAATIDLAATTEPTGTPASTVSLEQGVVYWMGYVLTTTATGPLFYIQNSGAGLGTNPAITQSYSAYSIFDSTDTGNTLPATAATSGWSGHNGVSRKLWTEISWA